MLPKDDDSSNLFQAFSAFYGLSVVLSNSNIDIVVCSIEEVHRLLAIHTIAKSETLWQASS
jgi:hypothetical protein